VAKLYAVNNFFLMETSGDIKNYFLKCSKGFPEQNRSEPGIQQGQYATD
jgi:hypothetical protein